MLMDEGLELLHEDQCMGLLSQAVIGRVAVTVGALPAIFPVNFVLQDAAIVFRTSAGIKFSAASDHQVVAFECDEMDPLEHTGWSVLVVGVARAVSDPAEVADLSRLAIVPWADGPRDAFVRIPIEFVSGRRIVHRSEEEP